MLKVGVVGAGYLGKKHLKIVENSSFFDLIGFYDENENTKENLSKNSNYVSFDQIDTLINAVDIIIIVTPTLSHFDLAKKVIKAKKHVFIEKPVCSTVEQAYQLIDLEDKNKVFGQVGHVERFNPAFEAIKSSIDSPQFIEAHRFAEFNPRGTDVSVVLDLMIHDIDIILTLIDSKIKTISGVGVPVISKTPDIANVRIEFENKAVVNLTASRISLKNMRKTRIFQKDTYISINYLNKEVEVLKIKNAPKKPNEYDMILENAEGVKKQILLKTPRIHDSNPIKEELSMFAESIINNTKPLVSLESGFKALDVAHKIIDSFK